ncbi:MAG TPA: MoxR family ATPase [Phycisphaeraceae bacterium]
MEAQAQAIPGDDVEQLRQASQGCQQLRQEISKVIIGQEQTVRALLTAILAQGHVLLIGVPGLAKTLLVKTLAAALGWKFHRIQFTPDMMPADIIGMELLQDDPATGRRSMRFVPGPIFANLILADEINRTPPKTQAALLEAMQEYTVTSMGRSYPLEKPFIVVATQNPIEQEGTYPLPEAQLDRFMFSLWMDYPSQEEEERIVLETTSPRDAQPSPRFTKEQMLSFQSLVQRVPASPHVVRYAVALARATRPRHPDASDFVRQYVEWGAGPRAAQHMVLAGKALAVIDGEPAVTLDHIRQAAPLVLRHRVLPNYQAVGEGIDAAAIVDRLLSDLDPAHLAPAAN